MEKTRDLQDVIPRIIFPPKSSFPSKLKDKRYFQKGPRGNFKKDKFTKD